MMVVSRLFDYLKTSKNISSVEEHSYKYANLGVTVRFGVSSLINGSDEALGCESLRLTCVHSMEDEPLKWCHVAREEEMREKLAV